MQLQQLTSGGRQATSSRSTAVALPLAPRRAAPAAAPRPAPVAAASPLPARARAVAAAAIPVSGPGATPAAAAPPPSDSAITAATMADMRRKIGEALETDAVSVTDVHGDGRHVSIDVVAAAFEGKSAVARQRLVYKVRALRVRACVCVAHAASAGRGRLCRGRRLLGGVCRPLRPPSADAYRSLTPSCPHVASSSPSARRPSGRSWRRRCTRWTR